MSNNHFISVSRAGVLMARRKGNPPVAVASASEGLRIAPGSDGADRNLPAEFVVRFKPGGTDRRVRVLDVRIGETVIDIDVFLRRFRVSDVELGRWMRAAVFWGYVRP